MYALLLPLRSMVPRVLPAQEGGSVLLRAVHQLPVISAFSRAYGASTYEEPHGCAEAGGKEAVQRTRGVDVDGVRAVELRTWGTHGGSVSSIEGQLAFYTRHATRTCAVQDTMARGVVVVVKVRLCSCRLPERSLIATSLSDD